MNKHLHRIIFNARRGLRMAVAETASTSGKSASGETLLRVKDAVVATALTAVAAACAFMCTGTVTSAHAQVVASPIAAGNQRATVLNGGNGSVQVNIQTPSAAGVSRNIYSQFDVSKAGAILNNSRGGAQTQIGGWVQGNPWLAAGSARVILNEVNSASPSQLKGYVEVAGPRSEVIIANPAGINVEGGGFINVSRLTLTTGTPVLGEGGLEAYRVQGGVITVNGAGLDAASADYTGIMARAVQVNAGLWAKELKVVTGANQVSADHSQSTPVAGSGQAPAFALDVSQLGGMYAGKIFLVGTEAGVGVRNAGMIGAGEGQLVLTSQGHLQNTGTIQGAGEVALSGASVSNSGAVSALGAIKVQGAGALDNAGSFSASGDLQARAANVSNRGTLAAGVDAQSGLTGNTGQLLVEADALLRSGGRLLSGGRQQLSGAAVDLEGGLATAQQLSVSASEGDIRAAGARLNVAEKLTLQASPQASVYTDGADIRAAALDIDAGRLSNRGGQLLQTGSADMTWRIPQGIDNTGGRVITNAANARLSGAALLNQEGLIQGAGSLQLGAQAMDNRGGTINAQSLQIETQGLDNRGGTLAAAGDAGIQLQVHAELDNGAGRIDSAGPLDLRAGALRNAQGLVQALGDLTVRLDTVLTNDGRMATAGLLQLGAPGLVNESGGEILANRGQVEVGTLANRGLMDVGDAQIRVVSVTNSGRIYGDNLGIEAVSVLNTADGPLAPAGTIAARGDLDLGVGTLLNREGALIYSGADMRIGGALDASGRATGKAASLTNASADIEAGGALGIQAQNLSNRNDHFAMAMRDSGDQEVGFVRFDGDPTAYSSSELRRLTLGEVVRGPGYAASLAPANRVSLAQAPLGCAAFYDGWCYDKTAPDYTYHWQLWQDVEAIDAKLGQNYLGAPTALLIRPDGSVAGSEPFVTGGNYVERKAGAETPAPFVAVDLHDMHAPGGDGKPFTIVYMRRQQDYELVQAIQSVRESVVTQSAPARLLSGGDMRLNVDVATNDKSQIVAGGALGGTLGALTNLDAIGTRVVTTKGTAARIHAQVDWDDSYGYAAAAHQVGATAVYAPAPQVLTTHLGVSAILQDAGPASAPATQNGAGTSAASQLPQIRTISLAGGTTPVQVRTVSADTRLPRAMLYQVQAGAQAHALIVTDKRFTQERVYASSDLQLQQLGLDPQQMLKRLGDGFYEQMLVAQQMLQLTGQRSLGGFESAEAQFQALLAAGAVFGKRMALQPGIALSDEQMRQLTSDIVWLVEQTVTLPDGSTQRVLAPQVYARVGDVQVLGNGALVAARSIDLDLSGDLTNSATLGAQEGLDLHAKNVANTGGHLRGQRVALSASDDLLNLGGLIDSGVGGDGGRGSVDLFAGRDLVMSSTARESVAPAGTLRAVDEIARVEGGDIRLASGRDTVISAASVSAEGSLQAQAGRDLRLGVLGTDEDTTIVWSQGNLRRDQRHDVVGSLLTAKGDVTLQALRDLSAQAAQVDAGATLALVAGRDLSLVAAQTSEVHSESFETRAKRTRSNRRVDSSASDVVGTNLHGNHVVLNAGRDIGAYAAQVNADDSLLAVAGRDITIEGAQATRQTREEASVQKKGFLSRQRTHSLDETSASRTVGSSLVGDKIELRVGRDLAVRGSQVVGTGDVAVVAGRDMNVAAGENTDAEHHEQQSKRSGLSFSGTAVSWGRSAQLDTYDSRQLSHSASLVGSLNGSVMMDAGRDVRVAGSQVLAGQNIDIAGRNVEIVAVQDTFESQEKHSSKQSGFTLGLGGAGILSSAQQVADTARQIAGSGDSRTRALLAMTGARSAWEAGKGVVDAVRGNTPNAGVQVSLSFGSSKSESQASRHSSTAAGSTLEAGDAVRILARGDEPVSQGAPAEAQGNLLVEGSRIHGETVQLAASNRIALVSAANTEQTEHSSKSSSASLGVTASLGAIASGLGVNASASRSTSQGESTQVSHTETQIEGRMIGLQSGGDTLVRGAQLHARRIQAQIGGDLLVASEQDTAQASERGKSQSAGVKVTILGADPSNVNASTQSQKANASYASVNEQSGLFAGEGGFDIKVKGHTELQGAVLASTAEAARNSLSTATLHASDIANNASYSASTQGASLSVGGGMAGRTTGRNVTGGVAPALAQHDGGQASSSTRSGVAVGSVAITDLQAQLQSGSSAEQTIAALNRDTGGSPPPLSRNPELARLLEKQQQRAQAASDAAQALAKTVGDIGKAMQDSADLRAGMRDSANGAHWGDDGLYRLALHAASQALVAELGGGNALGAASGTVAGSLAASAVSSATGNSLVASLAASAAGAAVGASSGSLASSSVDQFNRQLHPTEMDFIDHVAQEYARSHGISSQEASARLLMGALYQVDAETRSELEQDNPSGIERYKEAAAFLARRALDERIQFLNESGTLQAAFTATSTQFSNFDLAYERSRSQLSEQSERSLRNAINRSVAQGTVQSGSLQVDATGSPLRQAVRGARDALIDNMVSSAQMVWDGLGYLGEASLAMETGRFEPYEPVSPLFKYTEQYGAIAAVGAIAEGVVDMPVTLYRAVRDEDAYALGGFASNFIVPTALVRSAWGMGRAALPGAKIALGTALSLDEAVEPGLLMMSMKRGNLPDVRTSSGWLDQRVVQTNFMEAVTPDLYDRIKTGKARYEFDTKIMQTGQLDATTNFAGQVGILRSGGSADIPEGDLTKRNIGTKAFLTNVGLYGSVKDLLSDSPGATLPGRVGFKIDGRPTFEQLASLTRKHGVEFAVMYRLGEGPNGSGGSYFLYSGNRSGLRIPSATKGILVAHTHVGSSPFPSATDIKYLHQQILLDSPQRASWIVGEYGSERLFRATDVPLEELQWRARDHTKFGPRVNNGQLPSRLVPSNNNVLP